MNSKDLKTIRKWYLVVVLIHVVMMHVAFFTLAATFDFPEVLRQPPEKMLSLYTQNLSINIFAYYLFTLTGFSFVGLVILLHFSFAKRGSILTIASVFGVLAGIFQSFGFGRWVFLVPVIAARYQEATEQGKESLLMMLEAFHTYAGVLIGENLAFVCQGVWTILVSIVILKMVELPKSLGWAGIIVGVSVGGYSLEQFGGIFASLGVLNVAFQITWLLWMMAIGYFSLQAKEGVVQIVSRKEFLILAGIYGGMIASAYL